MSNLIQWPKAKWWNRDWNPVIGCQKISPACQNCWANAWADRFGQSFKPHRSSKQKPPKSGVVFVGGLTDMFGEFVEKEDSINYIARAQSNGSKDAVYIWLTKRPQRMCNALNHGWVCEKDYHPGEDILPEALGNHYFGFTAENQEWYDKRVEVVRKSFQNWANLWISVEPMLGPIDMRLHEAVFRPAWVVVGCESCANRRPCKIEWIESIVQQCMLSGIPVFVKQVVLPSGKFTNKIEEFPKHLQIRQVPWIVHEEIGENK